MAKCGICNGEATEFVAKVTSHNDLALSGNVKTAILKTVVAD